MHRDEFFPQELILPCLNCPIDSHCCFNGVFLEDYEALTLSRIFGEKSIVYDKEDENWRTSIKNGKCFFKGNNLCRIHSQNYYPLWCRRFPDPKKIDSDDYEVCPFISI